MSGKFLQRVFNIKPEESELVGLLFAYSFCIGLSNIFYATPADTFFLSNFEVSSLSYVYIFMAVASVILGVIYDKLDARLSAATLYKSVVVFLAICVIGIYVVMQFNHSKSLAMFAMVWKDTQLVFSLLVFWALTGALFNVRQGKRLFALIGAGEITAGFLGGFSVPVIVGLMGAQNLYLVSVIAQLCCIGLIFTIIKKYGKKLIEQTENEDEEGDEGGGRKTFRDLLKNRYILLFILFTMLSNVVYFTTDFMFYEQAETKFTNEEELAGFIGIFFGIVYVVNLIMNLFISGPLLTRFGLVAGLLLMPVLIIGGMAFALASAPFSDIPIAFFAIIMLTKLINEVLWYATQDPSYRVLYQPLFGSVRAQVQTFRESIMEPISTGLAGLLIFLVCTIGGYGIVTLCWIVGAITIAWILCGIVLRKDYVQVFSNAINKRQLSGQELDYKHPETLRLLRDKLDSPRYVDVIHSIQMLSIAQPDDLTDIYFRMLKHHDKSVRIFVIEKMGDIRLEAAAPTLRETISNTTETDIKTAAIEALCLIDEAHCVDEIKPYIQDPDIEVKKTAMIGLLKHGGIDGILAGGEELKRILETDEPKQRQLAADILGEVGITSLSTPLRKLINDSELSVSRTAITVAGKLRSPKLLPDVIAKLDSLHTHQCATQALKDYGKLATEPLIELYHNRPRDLYLRRKLVSLIGSVRNKTTAAFLKEQLTSDDIPLRQHALNTLVKNKQSHKDNPEPIHKLLQQEAEGAAYTLTLWHTLSKHAPQATDLTHTLAEQIEQARQRCIMLLALIYPQHTILSARDDLQHPSPDKQATALEIFDNLMDPNIKPMILPLLDTHDLHEKHKALTKKFPQAELSLPERLKQALLSEHLSSWAKINLIYYIGKNKIDQLADTIFNLHSHHDEYLRETVLWALHTLAPDQYRDTLTQALKDPSTRVAKIAAQLTNS